MFRKCYQLKHDAAFIFKDSCLIAYLRLTYAHR